MADQAGQSAAPADGFGGGFGERRGRGRGGRGRGGRGERRGRGDRRGRRGRRDDGEKGEWVPVTKLGRLVKDGKIDSLETIYTFSLPIKEAEIIDHFLPGLPKADPPVLRDEVMKIMPVQKQTRAGQRTKFKAFVVVGDSNGHIGLGVKCAKEVATAIRGAISAAKLQVIPVRRGWWGTKFGDPHTVPVKVTGRCGSVRVRLVPAPKGTGIVAAKAVRRVLEFAGIEDVYTNTTGKTATMGNFIKATFNACRLTYCYLTPDMWEPTKFRQSPYQEFTDFLKDSKGGAKKAIKDTA